MVLLCLRAEAGGRMGDAVVHPLCGSAVTLRSAAVSGKPLAMFGAVVVAAGARGSVVA
jgi:hypothetical protein